jgi:hypothetical protein
MAKGTIGGNAVVREIFIYIEGGGEYNAQQIELRQGFSEFFKELTQEARKRGKRVRPVLCGSRDQAFDDFKNNVSSNPDAFSVLLVDSEAPVSSLPGSSPWLHLRQRGDKWLGSYDNDQCHLMVQTMETWLLADRATLSKFYGAGFKEKALPKTANLEEIDGHRLLEDLKKATEGTKKGKYHKIRHASEILALLEVNRVRQACPHCEHFFATIEQKIGLKKKGR